MNHETSLERRGLWIDRAVPRFCSSLQMLYSDSEFSIHHGPGADFASIVIECRRMGRVGSAAIDLARLGASESEEAALDTLMDTARVAWERAYGVPPPRSFRFQRSNPKHLSVGDLTTEAGARTRVLTRGDIGRLVSGLRYATGVPSAWLL